jgi:hypothetical protein
VTPIREVDDRKIGEGKPGPVTREIQAAYFDIVKGRNPDTREWLDYLVKTQTTFKSKVHNFGKDLFLV